MSRPRPFLPLAALLALGAAPLVAQGAPDSVTIREWEVPWERTRPRDPSVAPDGRVWFVGQEGNYVGIFDPRAESFASFIIGTPPDLLRQGLLCRNATPGGQPAAPPTEPVPRDRSAIALPDVDFAPKRRRNASPFHTNLTHFCASVKIGLIGRTTPL